jgi:DNA-binding protein Fis
MTILTENTPYDRAVLQFKHKYLYAALLRHRGNQCAAAIELGIHRNTMARLASMDLDAPAPITRKRDCLREGR